MSVRTFLPGRRLIGVLAALSTVGGLALAAPSVATARLGGQPSTAQAGSAGQAGAAGQPVHRPAQPRKLTVRQAHTDALAARVTRRGALAAPIPGGPDLAWSDGTTLQETKSDGSSGPMTGATDTNVTAFEWAPDGSRYSVGVSGAARTRRADGSSPVTLGIVADPTVRDVAYGTSGQRVAVISKPASGNGRLQVRWSTGKGGGPVTLTPAVDLRDGDFLFAFNQMVVSAVPAGATTSRLYTLTINSSDTTGTVTALTPSDPGASAAGTSLSRVAASPNGRAIAFVQTGATTSSLWVMDSNGANARQLTSGDAAYLVGNPTFNSDGTVVYQAGVKTGGGTEIRAWPVTGGASTSVLATATPQVIGLSLRPAAPAIDIIRAAGTDRVGTAIEVSQEGWFGADPAKTCSQAVAQAVVLARSDLFPDALTGGPLAAKKCGPMLTTPPTALDPRVLTEIQRVLSPGRTVYVIGGTGAVSAASEARLKTAGYTVVRLSGTDRYTTSIAVAKQIVGTNTQPEFFFATGLNYPDALSAGPAAGAYGDALLLTADRVLPSSVNAYLNSFSRGVFGFAVGGQASAAVPWATKLSGADRYATNLVVATRLFYPPFWTGVATGTNFPDALAGGSLMGVVGQPLILASSTGLPTGARTLFDASSASLDGGWVFGGTTAVSEAVRTDMITLGGGVSP